jgi:DNA-binding CsgD family transcriptional regulator
MGVLATIQAMWQPQRPSFDRLAQAIYSLDLAEDAWMRGILCAVQKDCGGARDAFVGLGEIENGRPRPLHSVGTDDELALEARRQSTTLSPDYVMRRMQSFASTDRQLIGNEFDRTPHGVDWWERRRVEDVFVLSAFFSSGRFLAFGAHVPATYDPWPVELVEEWDAVAMHIASAARLHHAHASGTAHVDAMFTPDGRCVHSDGPPAAGRAALRDAIRRVERSRSRFRDKPVAVDARRPLVDGRWILCDQFDADGKHFVVAYAEGREARRPSALSDRETRVVELMISGWALKRIAYHLGLSEGAVASYAHRACTKLGVRSRVALAEAFARSKASGVLQQS